MSPCNKRYGLMTSYLPADCYQVEMSTLLHNILGHYSSRACRSVLYKCSTLPQTSSGFYVSALKVFENTVGKGEIANNEQFLLLPTVLSTL